MQVAETCFWVGIAWLGYVYIGYPICLYLLGLRRVSASAEESDFHPRVSVLISARNEEQDIEWKIRETLNWDYPKDRLQVLVASDASEDRTDEIVRSISDPRVVFIRMERRGGKNIALNQLTALATGELLLFTDANAHVSSSSFRPLVRHFFAKEVGCVTGWEQNIEAKRVLSSAGRTSLGYEAFMNTLESKLGSVLVCDGSLFCIRRSLYRQLQPDLANDLELPLWIGHYGFKILYEPGARSIEEPTSSVQEEFQRRRRICGQGALGMWRLRGYLHGLRRWQFISRKFLRWLSLLPITLIVTSSIFLSHTPIFQIVVASELGFGVFCLIGWIASVTGGNIPRVVALPFYFLLINVAALVGVSEACLGRRFSVWDIPSLSRGHGPTTA
ncbi:MAG: glycosyltransferase [Candidatus Sulfotelmatobacter sp.]